MNKPRIGDIIISKSGFNYQVIERNGDVIKTKPAYSSCRRKVKVQFSAKNLMCVDYDDGIWQEMES